MSVKQEGQDTVGEFGRQATLAGPVLGSDLRPVADAHSIHATIGHQRAWVEPQPDYDRGRRSARPVALCLETVSNPDQDPPLRWGCALLPATCPASFTHPAHCIRSLPNLDLTS
jgi:hypothetical protein